MPLDATLSLTKAKRAPCASVSQRFAGADVSEWRPPHIPTVSCLLVERGLESASVEP